VFGVYSSLVSLAFSSVAWPSGVGLTLGLILGLVLAYALIDRVLRAQAAAPREGARRRLATACCLLWGMTLPLSLGAAGLVWGAGFGVGTLVEGPVSTTVRETTHTWLVGANGLSATLLKRMPLAKRLSQRELLTLVQAAPEWISAALDQEQVAATWKKATGAPMPPQLAGVVRQQFHALVTRHDDWLHPVVQHLRERAAGNASGWPTVQEAIEAMVAPAVFQEASATIRATAGRDARKIALFALGLAAALAGALALAWRRPAPEAPRG
jgi:uncharacterized membrane protein